MRDSLNPCIQTRVTFPQVNFCLVANAKRFPRNARHVLHENLLPRKFLYMWYPKTGVSKFLSCSTFQCTRS